MFSDLQRPYLSIPKPARYASWLESINLYRVEHRWNHYLNQLTLATVLPWLEDQGSEQVQSTRQTQSQILPSPETATQRWQWVTGTAVAMGDQRLIVIPTDSLDASEFKVPQEWVDIPAWKGDYYLMVQLNPEAGQLQLRGYISHRQLKQGFYNERDRTYTVAEEALVQDVDLLWVMAELEYEAERQAELTPIVGLSQHQANSLIQQLAQQLQEASAASLQRSPRLALPFQAWASILSEPQFLNLLQDAIPSASNSASFSAQLSRWFEGKFEAAWQPLEQLTSPQLAWGWRGMTAQSISRGKSVALDGIATALSLWTNVTEEMDGKVKILVQLRHQSRSSDGLGVNPLPSGIEVRLLSPAGEAVQVVTAKEQDDYIQLKRFKVLAGQAFTVEVRLGNQTVREQFRA